jgi:hypothetical protein
MTKPKKKPAAAAAAPAPEAAPKGRPAGSRNIDVVVTVLPSACPKCQSTDRTPYVNPVEYPYAGVTADDRPYTHIVWRSTRCLGCGQNRKDRCYENRAEQSAAE